MTKKKAKIPAPESNAFVRAYLEAALWTGTDPDNDDEPLDKDHTIDDFAESALAKAVKDCNSFMSENEHDLLQTGSDEQNGHDFWLTRNGHGAGFWDRGYGEAGDRLAKACRAYRETYVIKGDDGKLHLE